MPPMPDRQPDQQVDHVEEAERALARTYLAPGHPPREHKPNPGYRAAQAHAAIAIAQELRGIREALSGRVEGRYQRALGAIVGETLDEDMSPNSARKRVYRLAAEALEGGSR